VEDRVDPVADLEIIHSELRLKVSESDESAETVQSEEGRRGTE
jgi:ribosome-binding ATPase YchF (GTP1/OBG family)